jgi:hypothetical protein
MAICFQGDTFSDSKYLHRLIDYVRGNQLSLISPSWDMANLVDPVFVDDRFWHIDRGISRRHGSMTTD